MLAMNLDRLVKYLLEGLAVALVTVVIPRKSLKTKEIAMIALTAAATFAVLDTFSPMIASGARTGTGFGVGFTMIGGSSKKSDCGCSIETPAAPMELESDSMDGVTGVDTEAGAPISE